MASLEVTTDDVVKGDPVAEHPGRGRLGRRRAADGPRRASSSTSPPKAAWSRSRGIRGHRGAHHVPGQLNGPAQGASRGSSSAPSRMDSVVSCNGKPAAGIQIYQLPGANALATARASAQGAAANSSPLLPEDVAYDVIYDTTVFVEATIESVIHTLIEAFILVASWCSSSSATSGPRSSPHRRAGGMIGTFAVMLALGYSVGSGRDADRLVLPGLAARSHPRRRCRAGRAARSCP